MVIGGFNIYNNASAETYEYNPATNTWSQKASLNVGRRYITSAVLNGKVYAIGGIGGAGPEILSSVEVYDPVNDTWTTTSSMPSERYGLSSAVINNEIYAIGGVTKPSESAGPATAEVNKYDPITETWSTVAPLILPRGLLSAASLNNEIYVAGGSNDPNYYSNFEKYSVKEVEVPPTQPEEPSTPEPETPNVGDRAILVITMVNGLEKEYDLSIAEVNKFLAWYDAKDAGSGPSKFAIDKHQNNIGPFSSRTDYVIFNNILTFEINKYTN
ncbi:N-acetylneuraminate epimerase precursor [compost metagenome]